MAQPIILKVRVVVDYTVKSERRGGMDPAERGGAVCFPPLFDLGFGKCREKVDVDVDSKELERFKQLLLEKRGELSSAWKGREALAPTTQPLHGDPADQATAASEAAIQVRLHQTDSKLLRAIDDALARVERGAYGTCEVCSEPITAVRLTAVPWTRLCLNCKEQQQQS